MADDETPDWFTRHTKQGQKAPPMFWGPGLNKRGDAALFPGSLPEGQVPVDPMAAPTVAGPPVAPVETQAPVEPPPTRFPATPPAGPTFALPPLSGGFQPRADRREDEGPALPMPAEARPEPGPPTREQWYTDPQFATTMPTTFGAAPTAAQKVGLAGGGLGALYAKHIKVVEDAAEAAAEAHGDIKEQQAIGLKQRADIEAYMKDKLKLYREGLEAARPELGKLERIPKAPDLTIRPWLDPEGKNAIRTIVQTLGMLAVGASGIAYGAPQTAMKWFRETAEAWRKDEIDAANSKLKQFETEVTRIKGNNDLALKEYEYADKVFAHNIDAKKAMVVTALDELKLHDESVQAAVAPYEESLKATKDRVAHSDTILKHVEKMADIQAKLQKASGNIPESMFKLGGELQGLQQRLEDPRTDPGEIPDIQRRIDALQKTANWYKKYETDKTHDRILSTQEGKKLGALEVRLGQTDHFLGGLNQLKRDFMVLEKKGLLRSGRTKGEEWKAWIKQQIPMNWDSDSRMAAQRIENFWPDFVVGQARTFWNDIGVRTKDAFGPLKGALLDFDSAMGFLNGAGDRIIEFRHWGNREAKELRRRLTGQEAVEETAEPYRLEGAVTETDEED